MSLDMLFSTALKRQVFSMDSASDGLYFLTCAPAHAQEEDGKRFGGHSTSEGAMNLITQIYDIGVQAGRLPPTSRRTRMTRTRTTHEEDEEGAEREKQ